MRQQISAPVTASTEDPAAEVTSEQAPQAWVAPSWEDVVAQHSGQVFRLAYRLTGDQHDAEDLTHETFIRVFKSLHRFKPGTFEGWLHRITTNLFLDSARRKKRIRFDGLVDNQADRIVSDAPSPDQALADADLEHDVAAALSGLAPEFRAAVVLCDIEGLSYEEVANVLDVKIGTVRSRIHRGRAQLRKDLAHRSPGPDRSHYSGIDVEAGPLR